MSTEPRLLTTPAVQARMFTVGSTARSPQARTLAEDRGIECLTLDYDLMRGLDNSENRLF